MVSEHLAEKLEIFVMWLCLATFSAVFLKREVI